MCVLNKNQIFTQYNFTFILAEISYNVLIQDVRVKLIKQSTTKQIGLMEQTKGE